MYKIPYQKMKSVFPFRLSLLFKAFSYFYHFLQSNGKGNKLYNIVPFESRAVDFFHNFDAASQSL